MSLFRWCNATLKFRSSSCGFKDVLEVLPGNDSHFDGSYFSTGLVQPPTCFIFDDSADVFVQK